MLHLFSESVSVTVEDVHFVLGPNVNAGSKDTDF